MSEKGEELLNSTSDEAKPTEASVSSDNQAKNISAESTTVSSGQSSDSDRARQEEEWRNELLQLESEMSTLRAVLTAKIKEAEELKKKLGITPIVEFKEDVKQGFQTFKESEPVQKTSAAIKDFGEFASKKLENIRNSNAFKSVEEKVGGAYSSVKKRISSTKSEEDENPEMKTVRSAEGGVSNPTAKDYVPLEP